MAADQAAGLRRWAEQLAGTADAEQSLAPAPPVHSTPAPRRELDVTLLVVGVPGAASSQTRRVQGVLARWASAGQRWVGTPTRWKVVPLEADSPHLAVLASQQSRWGLWVGDDEDAFRRAWRQLRTLREHGGPSRLLLLHDGIPSGAGLLDNLRQAALGYLQVDLLVLAEPS